MFKTKYYIDLNTTNEDNYPSFIYRLEYKKILLEILDKNHLFGKPKYFSSIKLRDEYINKQIDHLLLIDEKEVKKIQKYWQKIS